MNNEKEKYQQFCLDLTERYLRELSGEGENSEYIINSRPSEKILIGILDSGIKMMTQQDILVCQWLKYNFLLIQTIKGNLK